MSLPEHLRSLPYLLLLGGVALHLAGPVLFPDPEERAALRRRTRAWIAVTVCAFAAHDIWIFLAGSAVIIHVAARRESNPLALYLSLLFAVPLLTGKVSGLGVFQHLFELHHARLLSLVLLLPVALRLYADKSVSRLGTMPSDRFLLGFLGLQFFLMLAVNTVTNTIRWGGFYALLDIFLPYYVASRGLRDPQKLGEALRSLTLAGTVLSVVAVFETLRSWLLYPSLETALGVQWSYGNYLARGEGALRAQASTGQPIALGFILMVCLCVAMATVGKTESTATRTLILGALCAGLLASLSRGPWVGALLGLFAFLVVARQGSEAARGFALVLFAIGGGAMLTPMGERIVEHLPFVGAVDSENVAYRQQLFEVGLRVLAHSPFFGAYDFLYAMEEMRQGQGIIDIVNTYLGIALSSGLIGLALFAGALLVPIPGLLRGARAGQSTSTAAAGVLSALLAASLTLATTSIVESMSYLLWVLVGVANIWARVSDSPRALAQRGITPYKLPR